MRGPLDVPVDPRLTEEAVNFYDTFSDRPSNAQEVGSPDFESLPGTIESAFLSEWCEVFRSPSQCETSANAVSEYAVPRFDAYGRRAFARDPRHSSLPTILGHRNESPMGLRSVLESEIEQSQAAVPQAERRGSITNMSSKCLPEHNKQQDRSSAPPDLATTFMSATSPEPETGVPSKYYTPFSGAFENSEQAGEYRRQATRFERKPYRPPDEDETLLEVANNRQRHVKRIYEAMVRPDAAQDNPGSIAMRRWVHSAYYPATLVEAYAHKVFDCLLKQAEEGFRGWHHNDYASDERKGSETEDKNLNCSERLNSIIRSLEQEKTVCEDVMNSACQIRMFVNAPRAYAARKSANRAGNSKRKKATDFPTATVSRSVKSRRHNSTSMSKSRASAPPSQSQPQPSRATKPIPAQTLHQLAPRLQTNVSHGSVSSGNHLTHPTMPFLSPLGHPEIVPRFTSAPTQQHSPFMSPPPLSLYSNSVTNTPEQLAQPLRSMRNHPWPIAGGIPEPSQPAPFRHGASFDPILWQHDNDGPLFPDDDQMFQFDEETSNGPYFHTASNVGAHTFEPSFQTYWADQHGVQTSPNDTLGDDTK